MKRWRVMVKLLAVACVISCCGCAAVLVGTGAALGAGAVAYLQGGLVTTEQVSLDKGANAAREALADMNFFIGSSERNSISETMTASGSSERRITIKLKKVSDTLTEIRIRVGLFGDEQLSRMILDKMKKKF